MEAGWVTPADRLSPTPRDTAANGDILSLPAGRMETVPAHRRRQIQQTRASSDAVPYGA